MKRTGRGLIFEGTGGRGPDSSVRPPDASDERSGGALSRGIISYGVLRILYMARVLQVRDGGGAVPGSRNSLHSEQALPSMSSLNLRRLVPSRQNEPAGLGDN